MVLRFLAGQEKLDESSGMPRIRVIESEVEDRPKPSTLGSGIPGIRVQPSTLGSGIPGRRVVESEIEEHRSHLAQVGGKRRVI